MDEKARTELLEQLKNDPGARETLENIPTMKTAEEMVAAFSDLTKKLGYNVNGEELIETFRAAEEQRRKQTEEAAAQIERLSDDEVAQAAGGAKPKENCKDTYLDRENCTLTDGCDKSFNDYGDYLCDSNDAGAHCGADQWVLAADHCSSLFVCNGQPLTCGGEYYRPGCGNTMALA